MSDATSKTPRARETPPPLEGKWWISAILITLTFVVAAACITILAVTLIQTRAGTLVIDGVAVGVPKIDYVGRRWVEVQHLLKTDAEELRKKDVRRADLASKATAADLQRKAKRGDVETLLAAFFHRIESGEPELAAQIRNRGHQDQVGRILGARSRLVEKDPTLEATIKQIEAAYDGYRKADIENDAAQANLNGVLQEIATVQATLNRNKQAIDEVFSIIKADLDEDARQRIENTFYELNIDNYKCGRPPFERECGAVIGLVNRGFYRLLTLRPDLLTLTLVILMGVLGSALQMSHAYFMKSQVQTLGGYFQRVTVGAMTALVIFIVAKAGVPVLADPSRLGGDAPINPYFVSFLAIISGLLSENAIANIQAQGARMFGSGTDIKRWSREDLTAEVEQKGSTVGQLANYLGVREAMAAAMLKGEEPLDSSQQKMVALCLGRDIRSLFTDIPPPVSASTVAWASAPAPTTTPAPTSTTTPPPTSGG